MIIYSIFVTAFLGNSNFQTIASARCPKASSHHLIGGGPVAALLGAQRVLLEVNYPGVAGRGYTTKPLNTIMGSGSTFGEAVGYWYSVSCLLDRNKLRILLIRIKGRKL